MKVLLPASEVAPIVKLGGLGDVIGSLPKALEKVGVNADVIIPFYPTAKVQDGQLYKSLDLEVPFNNTSNSVEVFKTKLPGSNVDVFLLRNKEYFVLGGKDAFINARPETEMFAFFSRAVVEFVKAEFNTYDLVHCNDWHTGMITHLLQDELEGARPATLFTIHNLGYQGIGDLSLVKEMGIVPGDHPLIEWDIADGDINFIQQGITSSDYVNAVSPTYAKEILTEEFGGELTDVLRAREGRLTGILNGIDYSAFPREFDESNWQTEKRKHKEVLIKELDLGTQNLKRPLLSFIGRLDPNQKGLDILVESIPGIVKAGGSFVLLGTGDSVWEEKLKKLAQKKSLAEFVSINIAFDIELAQKIYSGSDFLLIPSRYEPCGLIQMIAMWFGTVPIVHATGGLKDSVKDGQNGFLFDDYTSSALLNAVKTAVSTYSGQDDVSFEKIVEGALTEDFSWGKSAQEYKNLYERVINA
ncbi:glycogen synthase [bacterium]|nr:glycogen synthase [bacterium]